MFYAIIFFILISCSSRAISTDPIKNRKKEFIQQIYQDPHKIDNPSYQPYRVIATVSCPDCDDIPKVDGAGEIFDSPDGPYQRMHNGVKIHKDCYYGEDTSWMTDIIYALHGHHEPQEEKAFHEILQFIPPGGTMLELGSYWAYYSLWFAHAISDAHNYMVDTTQFYLDVGKKNFLLNGKSGHFELGHIGYYPEHQSPQIYIDTFLQEHGIKHVDIIHADIQGAELDMLRSCEQSIAKNMIDYFVISTHYEGEINNELHEACLAFLKEKKFHIIVEHTPAESCSADGLIVAKRPGLLGPDHITVSKYNATPSTVFKHNMLYRIGGSQLGSYPQFCSLAAHNEEVFKTFRQNINFVDVVETMSYELGIEFARAINDRYPYLLPYFEKICFDDVIGSPVQYFFPSLGFCSPTTLRYVKIAGDLQREFGDLRNFSIVEIGGGCGGQCKILHDTFGFWHYTIVDIPEAIQLTARFLSSFKISNITLVNNINLNEPLQADLVISNYAFSEIDKEEQLHYMRTIINSAPRGYMIYNRMPAIHPLSVDEFATLLINQKRKVRILKEDPMTGEDNLVIVWHPINQR